MIPGYSTEGGGQSLKISAECPDMDNDYMMVSEGDVGTETPDAIMHGKCSLVVFAAIGKYLVFKFSVVGRVTSFHKKKHTEWKRCSGLTFLPARQVQQQLRAYIEEHRWQ
eukprot:gene3745-4004_t